MSKTNDKKLAVAELVCRALADLRDPQGSSEKQIREYIEINYKIPDATVKQSIKTALKTGVAFGLISKKKGYYQLSKLVDNIRVIATKRHSKTQRGRSQKSKIHKTVRTPAIRKTTRKIPRMTKRGRPKNVCIDLACNKKCGKQHIYKNATDLKNDEDYDSQEDAFDEFDERDDEVEETDSQDNEVADRGYANDDEVSDEEMEADDQEEYESTSNDEESDAVDNE